MLQRNWLPVINWCVKSLPAARKRCRSVSVWLSGLHLLWRRDAQDAQGVRQRAPGGGGERQARGARGFRGDQHRAGVIEVVEALRQLVDIGSRSAAVGTPLQRAESLPAASAIGLQQAQLLRLQRTEIEITSLAPAASLRVSAGVLQNAARPGVRVLDVRRGVTVERERLFDVEDHDLVVVASRASRTSASRAPTCRATSALSLRRHLGVLLVDDLAARGPAPDPARRRRAAHCPSGTRSRLPAARTIS